MVKRIISRKDNHFYQYHSLLTLSRLQQTCSNFSTTPVKQSFPLHFWHINSKHIHWRGHNMCKRLQTLLIQHSVIYNSSKGVNPYATSKGANANPIQNTTLIFSTVPHVNISLSILQSDTVAHCKLDPAQFSSGLQTAHVSESVTVQKSKSLILR